MHRSSLHSVPLAIRLISKPTPRTFQVHTKKNQRIISCFPAWDRMREDWKQKRKQVPEPDGGGACVWILNLSLCSSVNALYHCYARAHEKIQKGAEKIKTAHRSSLHSVPLAIRLISKPTPSPHQAKSTHYLMFSRMGQNERGLETKKKAGPGAGWRRGLRVDS